MPRAEAFASGPASPVEKYLKWSSTKSKFTYYDKALGSDVEVDLPMKFIYLDARATIAGYHKASESSLYSNEVTNTKEEAFAVRSHKVKFPLVEGKYADIKGKIEELGGNYHASIYVYAEGLGLINLAIKGAALGAWSEFASASRRSFLGSYIEISGAEKKKNGVVTYSVPVFKVGGPISIAESEKSDKVYDELASYFKSRKSNQSESALGNPVESDVIFPPAEELPQAPSPEAEFDGLPF